MGAINTVAASISDIRLLLKVKALPKSSDSRRVFITGGTGYIGSGLIPILIERGHRGRALIRSGSAAKLLGACEVVSGDACDANSYRQLIRPADTFIHLFGVSHPFSAKSGESRAIELASARGAVDACAEARVRHWILLSIAHPSPILFFYS